MKRILLSILIIGIFLLSACGVPTYTLSTSVSPSGIGSVSPSGGQYESGVQVTLTATPASGYTFDYWDGDASDSSPTITVIMDSDKSVIAHFADTAPPVISGVGISNITETSATLTWMTDEPATSQVEYGKAIGYGSTTPLADNLVSSHSISLTGLETNTTYHFRVKSKDEASNETRSGDYTFVTSAPSPKAEVQILEHYLVQEDYPPPASFSMTFVRGKVKNRGDVILASVDVTIWVQYEVEGLEGRVFNMPGSIDLEPAAFKLGEVRNFEVLVQNGAKEGYEISVSIMSQ
jgi:hypothetical protein